MRRIYLDTCIWCRPFDKPSKRIEKEAEAFIKILKGAERGKFIILGSPQLEVEINEIRDKRKRKNVMTIFNLANIEMSDMARESLQKEIMDLTGLTEEDSFHLAFAVEGKVRYFITADDEILKKGNNRGEI